MIVIRKGGVAQNESHHPKFLHKKIMFQKIILNDHLLHIYKQIYIEQVEEKNLIFSKINYQQLFLLYILPLKKLFQKSR